jgi:hypothetical protein
MTVSTGSRLEELWLVESSIHDEIFFLNDME